MSEATITNSAQGSYPTTGGGRPSKVAIIGAGAVGSTLAYACVTKGVAREVVLQDIVKSKVEAEALDIAQGIQFTSAGSVSGSDDPEICRDADVIAITAGAKQKPGQSRLELAGATVGIMEKILPKLVEVAPHAIFLLVANPVDVVTYCAKKITGLPENQVFGSGTVLDTARMRYLISLETGTATQNIHGYIAGEHGDSEVALWSSTEIGGVPITQWGKTTSGGEFDEEVRERIAHDVVRSAALGTRNRPLAPAGLPEPVARALHAASGPELVLEAAAAYALAQRGTIPSAPVTALELPAASSAPVMPDEMSDLLARMLTLRGQDELVTRTLRLIRRRGLRLPPNLLTRVASRFSDEHRTLVVDLMDARARAIFAMDGRWAGLIDEVESSSAPPDPVHWESGTGRERAAHLARVRAHDPAAGRALLADGAWLEARAAEREQILAALSTGLGPQDEALLEARLDDRAESVRRTAADLLRRLPSSALVRRTEALARTHVVVTKRFLRAPRVELLPVALTDELARDQYPARAHRASAALTRALEMVARVPTGRWRRLVGLSAVELLEAEVRCEGQRTDLSEALTRAALQWEDGKLASALVDRAPTATATRLVALLDTPDRDAFIDRLVAAGQCLRAAATCEAWPLTLSPKHSGLIARCIVEAAAPSRRASERSLLTALGGLLPGRCAPEAVEDALAILEAAPAEALQTSDMRTIMTALELRRELLGMTNQEAP